MDLFGAALSFIHCSELGGSTFRGTDLLVLVGNQSVSYCLPIVERLSLFHRVCLGRFYCICFVEDSLDISGKSECANITDPISCFLCLFSMSLILDTSFLVWEGKDNSASSIAYFVEKATMTSYLSN